jgi:hypothetical protein
MAPIPRRRRQHDGSFPDAEAAEEFGYKPELKRTLGSFQVFAVSLAPNVDYPSSFGGFLNEKSTLGLHAFGFVSFRRPCTWWSTSARCRAEAVHGLPAGAVCRQAEAPQATAVVQPARTMVAVRRGQARVPARQGRGQRAPAAVRPERAGSTWARAAG